MRALGNAKTPSCLFDMIEQRQSDKESFRKLFTTLGSDVAEVLFDVQHACVQFVPREYDHLDDEDFLRRAA